MRTLAVITLLAVGCGSSEHASRDASLGDLAGEVACPSGAYSDDPPTSCSVLGQHCYGFETGANCIGCGAGPYFWETDEVYLACDGGLSGPVPGDAGAATHLDLGYPICPAGVDDDTHQVACTVLHQHCVTADGAYPYGADCIGCGAGPYHWETDLIGLSCDGG